jgi:glycosyltransferase involved in cell wall biosynthesis
MEEVLSKNMKLALVTNAYPPMRSSGAIQLADLVEMFVEQGHCMTVFTTTNERIFKVKQESISDNCVVLRLGSMSVYGVCKSRRLIAELTSPYFMALNYFSINKDQEKFDAVIWYSPSIFLGPFVHLLKSRSKCKSYLILRDIFPDWAYDLKIIKSQLVYRFLKQIELSQYKLADIIGVQSNDDISYVRNLFKKKNKDVRKLNNWITPRIKSTCSINLKSTVLNNKKIIVYAGNMGLAQGMDNLFQLLIKMKFSDQIGFLFVGRGEFASKLDIVVRENEIKNVLHFDEIDPKEIPGLYDQCHCGLVSLDYRHRHHNIPGKFLSYINSGLPVFAILNQGNELINLIRDYKIGDFYTGVNVGALELKLEELLLNFPKTSELKKRCTDLHNHLFSTNIIGNEIINSLVNKND